MKSFIVVTVSAALLVCQAFALRQIRTEVYCSKTGEDLGSFVELNTTIKESGNGQLQSATQKKVNLGEGKTFPGIGALIANTTFSGALLPRTMSVTVFEDDAIADDGVCKLDITAAFSKIPIYVKCTRETTNGLFTTFIVTAKVFEV